MATGYDIMMRILREDEGRLASELRGVRATFDQAGIKGAGVEHGFREFLRRYMPRNTGVGHGEAFDIDGRVSKQTDVVVANEYHVALRPGWDEPQKFTIESVECAGEVKSTLTDQDAVRDCFDKARAFKRLLMNPDLTHMGMSMGDDERRYLHRRPYFAFAFESRLTLETIWEKLTVWDEGLRQVEQPAVDGVFVLDRGTLLHMGRGKKGRLSMKGADGERLGGYLPFPADGGVLTRLLFWMYAAMPRVQHFGHPVSSYLQPISEAGRLWLNDRGEVERKT